MTICEWKELASEYPFCICDNDNSKYVIRLETKDGRSYMCGTCGCIGEKRTLGKYSEDDQRNESGHLSGLFES